MNKKQLALAAILLIATSTFSSVANARITCTAVPEILVYECKTDSLGPLAVAWNWTTFGNLGGNWLTPQGNPQRDWWCGEPGAANMVVAVTIEWSDETFTTEHLEIDCYTISQGRPPTPRVVVNWEYCIGNTPVFFISWGPGAGTIGTVTAYKLEQRVNLIWQPLYQGSASHMTFGCPSRTYMRIKAYTVGGWSSWRYFWAVKDCGSGAGHPD